jgi:hypothetical protein
MLGRCGCAQEKPDSPEPKTTQTTQSPSKTATKDNNQEANDEVPKRIFWIIPNFMTANDQPQNLGPLTPKQKFNIAWHQWWDVSAHIGNLLQASISQAANGIPEYGQGWSAFGERYAAQEGDQFTGAMLIYGVLPTILHDDPRYFRKGRGSALSRIGYAASRSVICRTDSGKNTFNIPQVFGQLGQASISLSYYPQVNRNVGGLFSGWAHQSDLQHGMESAEGIHAGPGRVFEPAASKKAQTTGSKRQPYPDFSSQLALRRSPRA